MSRFIALFVLAAGMGVSSLSFAEPGEAAAASDAVAGEAAEEADEAAAEEKAEDSEEAEGDAAEALAEDAAEDVGDDKEEVAESLDDAADQVGLLIKAVQDKNWSLAIGLLMMLLVFGANKFGLKDKIGSKAVPWAVMGLSVLSVCGAGLASGVAISEALIQGVLAGVAAIGGWELMFKHLLVKKSAE